MATDAFAVFRSILDRYNLSELHGWAQQALTSGKSPAVVELELWDQPAFRKRFRAIFEREASGLPALSPEEVITYERERADLLHAAGLPAGFYDDPEDAADSLAKNVSIRELSTRVVDGLSAAMNEPPETRQAFQDFYGVDEGGLAAFFLDPERSTTLLQRQFDAARAAGAARRTGFGDISLTEAETLSEWGVTGAQATVGFGMLAGAQQLFQALPGTAEGDFSRRQVLAAGFQQGSAELRELERRARTRTATFEGGGGFAAGREGFAGLGTTSE